MTQFVGQEKPSLDDLVHVGVLGMKWGHRKASDSSTNGPPKLSRKEFKAKVKKERSAFYEKKSNSLIKETLKNPDTLIKLYTPSDPYPTVVTGREFALYLAKGGVMNVKLTDIYATKNNKNGPYVLNEQGNRVYKKPKR